MLPHVGVHCREGIVKEVDVGVAIHGPGQAHALLLAARQVHALGRDTLEGWASWEAETDRGGHLLGMQETAAVGPSGLHPPPTDGAGGNGVRSQLHRCGFQVPAGGAASNVKQAKRKPEPPGTAEQGTRHSWEREAGGTRQCWLQGGLLILESGSHSGSLTGEATQSRQAVPWGCCNPACVPLAGRKGTIF